MTLDGEYNFLSLKDIFEHAHELRELIAEHPLTIPALMGILHCIIYQATGGPKDIRRWAVMLKAGRFGGEIQDYLTKWHDHFDLFSPVTPFYQTAGLTTLGESGKPSGGVPITTIVQQLSSGNNKTVFDHTLDRNIHALSPAESALALITIQNSGLRGTNKKNTDKFGYQKNFSDAQLANGMVLFLRSRSLYETVSLNLLPRRGNSPVPNTSDDCPVWELPSETVPKSGNTNIRGYLHLLTPQCRHIRLIPEIDGAEVVVRRMHIAQGEAFRVKDPRFAYSKPKEEGRDSLPRKMQSSRVIWRDSEALFGLGDNRPHSFVNTANAMDIGIIGYDRFKKYLCTAHGMMSKNAKISDWRTDHLQIPASVFVEKVAVEALLEGVDIAETIAKHIGTAIKKAASVILPKSKDDRRNLIKHMLGNSETFYWQELDLPFQDFVLSLPDNGSALKKWFSILKKCAEDALLLEFETMSFDLSRHLQAWVKAEEILKSSINKTGKQKGVTK